MTPTYVDNLALTFIAVAAFLAPLAVLGLLIDGAIRLYTRLSPPRPRPMATFTRDSHTSSHNSHNSQKD